MARSGKGSAFERRVCRTLSLWWSDGADDSLFWRTAASGGRATVRSKQGKHTTGHNGDICATSADGQPLTDLVAIECKKGYSRHTFADLIDKPDRAAKQELEKWIAQAEASRAASGAFAWLLITERDRRATLALMPWRLYRLLFAGADLQAHAPLARLFLACVADDVCVVRLDYLLATLNHKHVRQLAKRIGRQR